MTPIQPTLGCPADHVAMDYCKRLNGPTGKPQQLDQQISWQAAATMVDVAHASRSHAPRYGDLLDLDSICPTFLENHAVMLCQEWQLSSSL